ncbi:hypothetical protein [Paraclostridium sordellii]|uniref:hypothetical protein n=1 Tax=Paraclostridium sordellii TaxID=1505 RepID=UPI0012D7D140|nr:hypothetical protein [Paeniclostridium sordellii]
MKLADKTDLDENGNAKVLTGTCGQLRASKDLGRDQAIVMERNTRENDSYYEKRPAITHIKTGEAFMSSYVEIKIFLSKLLKKIRL